MKNYIVSALVIFLIALGIMMFLTLPEYEKFISSRQQLQADKAELVEREDYLSELFGLSQRLGRHQDALDKISSALPPYPDFPSLMVFLSEKASESGLIVRGTANVSTVYQPAGEGGSSSEVKPINFDVILMGGYPSLKSFTQAVESSSRLIRIPSISSSEDADTGSYVHRVTVEAFFHQN